jgi:hypothetical protein
MFRTYVDRRISILPPLSAIFARSLLTGVCPGGNLVYFCEALRFWKACIRSNRATGNDRRTRRPNATASIYRVKPELLLWELPGSPRHQPPLADKENYRSDRAFGLRQIYISANPQPDVRNGPSHADDRGYSACRKRSLRILSHISAPASGNGLSKAFALS